MATYLATDNSNTINLKQSFRVTASNPIIDVEIAPSLKDQNMKLNCRQDTTYNITMNAVTADIDENLISENIKMGISILGVTGNLDSTGSGIAGGAVNEMIRLIDLPYALASSKVIIDESNYNDENTTIMLNMLNALVTDGAEEYDEEEGE